MNKTVQEQVINKINTALELFENPWNDLGGKKVLTDLKKDVEEIFTSQFQISPKWVRADLRLPIFSYRTISRFIHTQTPLFDVQEFLLKNPHKANLIEWLDESSGNVSPQAGEPGLPTDEQILDWYAGNIDFDSPPLSAIKEFVLWLKSSAPLSPVVKEEEKKNLHERVTNGLNRELQRQKESGKEFLSDEAIDNLIDKIIKDELSKKQTVETANISIITKMAEDSALKYSAPYCEEGNHSFDCMCIAHEEGYIEGYKAAISTPAPTPNKQEQEGEVKDVLTPKKKFLITAELRDLENQVTAGQISYSRMVEILNEKAVQYFSTPPLPETDVAKMAEERYPVVALDDFKEDQWEYDPYVQAQKELRKAFISGYQARTK